jgi:hypothetical protein
MYQIVLPAMRLLLLSWLRSLTRLETSADNDMLRMKQPWQLQTLDTPLEKELAAILLLKPLNQ